MRDYKRQPVGFVKSKDAARLKQMLIDHQDGIAHLDRIAEQVGRVADNAVHYLSEGARERQSLHGMSGWYDDFQVTLGDAIGPVIDGAGTIIGNAYTGVANYVSDVTMDDVGNVAAHVVPGGMLIPAGVYVVDKAGEIIGEVKDAAGNAYDATGNAIGRVMDAASNAASSATTAVQQVTRMMMFGAIAIGLIIFYPEIKAVTRRLHKG